MQNISQNVIAVYQKLRTKYEWYRPEYHAVSDRILVVEYAAVALLTLLMLSFALLGTWATGEVAGLLMLLLMLTVTCAVTAIIVIQYVDKHEKKLAEGQKS